MLYPLSYEGGRWKNPARNRLHPRESRLAVPMGTIGRRLSLVPTDSRRPKFLCTVRNHARRLQSVGP